MEDVEVRAGVEGRGGGEMGQQEVGEVVTLLRHQLKCSLPCEETVFWL